MINLFKVHLPEAVDKPLLNTLHSGYVTQGAKVDEFEALWIAKTGDLYPVSVNSGTSALTLALRLAGVGRGDKVITTAMTCSATNLPILSLGAMPIFADIDPLTGLIDPQDVKAKLTPDVKAIMAVDWGGQPVDVEALNNLGIKVIVDAAHAIGAGHNARPDFLCYSLQAIKHITTIDGGVLVCKTEEDYKRAKKLRWFGIDREADSLDSRIDEDITEWGYKFHMNDVAATIGIVQLDYVVDILDKQKGNASFYAEYLSHYYKRPSFDLNSSYWLYTILLPNQEMRDKFKRVAAQNDIQVSQVHRRNDEYTVFQPYTGFLKAPLINLEDFSSRMVCVPVHWGLTQEERNKVLDFCNSFAELYQ